MAQKISLKTLPKPSVFKKDTRWVCEYHEFDERGVRKVKRKAFVRDLRRKGMDGTSAEQKEAAEDFAKKQLKLQTKEIRLRRAEREQRHLTPLQLKEAKAAFAIFDQIEYRKKSLVDAVILYRESLASIHSKIKRHS